MLASDSCATQGLPPFGFASWDQLVQHLTPSQEEIMEGKAVLREIEALFCKNGWF